MKILQLMALAFCGIMMVSCGNDNLKDVSNEPAYQGMANNIYFTNQPLYYYNYKEGNGVKTDHYLSLHPNDSNGEKVKDIPQSSHIKVSKVYEITEDDGGIIVWITGEVFPTPNEKLEYETAFLEEAPFFEEKN